MNHFTELVYSDVLVIKFVCLCVCVFVKLSFSSHKSQSSRCRHTCSASTTMKTFHERRDSDDSLTNKSPVYFHTASKTLVLGGHPRLSLHLLVALHGSGQPSGNTAILALPVCPESTHRREHQSPRSICHSIPTILCSCNRSNDMFAKNNREDGAVSVLILDKRTGNKKKQPNSDITF